MTPSRLLSLLLLATALVAAPASARDPEELEEGDWARVEVRDLRPSQPSVGMLEVDARGAYLSDLEEHPRRLKKHLKKKRISVIKGPGDQLYIVDGHHLARAAYEQGIRRIYVEVKTDWSHLSPKQFWRQMKRQKYTYLKTPDGRVLTPEQLPRSVARLTDDPYRSLAWIIRKAGGYEKTDIDFQEFYWADFFRSRVELNPRSAKSWEEATRDGLKLAVQAVARGLPGFTPGKHRCDVKELLEELLDR